MSLTVRGKYNYFNIFYYEKFKFKKLKLEATEMLQRNELKTVLGSYTDGSNPCCLSWNYVGFTDCGYSVNEAQWKYNSGWTPVGGDHAGQTVTGYCCSSC